MSFGKSPGRHDYAQNASRRTLVLHVLPQDLNRGAQMYAGRLRDALVDDPRQAHLVVTLFRGIAGGARPDVQLDVPTGGGRQLLDLRAAWRLRRLIRSRGAEVIIAHGGEALKYVLAASGRLPTVYYKVGLSTAEIERPLHKALYRFLSLRASRVVGNSSAVVNQVGEIFGVPEERRALIPNGRDSQAYRPLREGEKPSEPPRIIFVGQFEPGKRPDLFLDVIDLLRRGGARFDAVMVGDGPLRKALEDRAEDLGVQLLGTRSDIPALLRESALLVMTSAPDTEGMPGVLIEAGLSGIPSVATAAAGVTDVIDDGQTGFVVGGAQPAQLADRITELLAAPDRRRAQGDAARSRCLERFSMDVSAEQWRTLAGDLVSKREQRVGPE